MDNIRYVLAIALLLFTILWALFISQANASPNYTELMVFNPYSSISLKIMVKCDHNHKTNKYDFYKVVVIKRSSNIVIKAPVGLKKCEIWPIDIKMFGDLR